MEEIAVREPLESRAVLKRSAVFQEKTAIGYIPKRGSVNLDGLPRIDWTALMSIPREYWEEDIDESRHFLESQVSCHKLSFPTDSGGGREFWKIIQRTKIALDRKQNTSKLPPEPAHGIYIKTELFQ